MGDEFGEYRMNADIDHAAGGALTGTDLLAFGVEELVGYLAKPSEQVGVEDVFYRAESVLDELGVSFSGIAYWRGHRRFVVFAWAACQFWGRCGCWFESILSAKVAYEQWIVQVRVG